MIASGIPPYQILVSLVLRDSLSRYLSSLLRKTSLRLCKVVSFTRDAAKQLKQRLTHRKSTQRALQYSCHAPPLRFTFEFTFFAMDSQNSPRPTGTVPVRSAQTNFFEERRVVIMFRFLSSADVTVTTFHAYCNQIVREFPTVLGFKKHHEIAVFTNGKVLFAFLDYYFPVLSMPHDVVVLPSRRVVGKQEAIVKEILEKYEGDELVDKQDPRTWKKLAS